jgi:Amt family ammonium transporter
MHPWAACCTGLIAGLVYYGYSKVTPRLKIDDPVDAIALHLGGGSWGLIAFALFADNTGILINWTKSAFLVRTIYCIIIKWTFIPY